jgi:hypothetical protein
MTAQDPNKPEDQKPRPTSKDHEDEGAKGFLDYAKTNTRDTIAYIILIVGVIMLFFEPFLGQLLIGIIAGLYFAVELDDLLKNGNTFIEEQGIVRSIILGVTALAFLIAAPGIFIGAAIAILLRLLFGGLPTSSSKDDK